MIKYLKYKPSGIEWIGEIPEHWRITKLKNYFSVSSGDFSPMVENKDSGFPIYGGNGFRGFSENFNTEGRMILIGRVGAQCGNVRIADGRFWVSEHALKVQPKKEFSLDFFFYLLQIIDLNQFAIKTAQPLINSTIVTDRYGIIPPLYEQTAIAEYLDNKTAQIDELIAKKERLIELLEEEKTAVINEAVTGKAPITKNQTTKYKDSGIECLPAGEVGLGEIPEHWEVKKLKYVGNIVLGKMLTNNNKGNYKKRKYIRAANLEWLNVNVEDVKEMWFSDDELQKLRLKENDLLVSEGGEVGRTCIWKNEIEECYIQNSVHKITVNCQNNSYFFLYQFFLYGKKGAFDSIVNRISIAHLTGEKLKEIEFVSPPLKEQTQIVNYIEKETTRIDKTIERTKKLIKLLKEYRTALISEVVTGKIKVI